MADHLRSCPKLVGQRVKRREDPRLIQGRGTYVDDIEDRRHAASGVQAQRHRARPHPLDRHQRRGGDGRRRSGLHRRADRGAARADADRHALSLARPSRRRRSTSVRYAGEPVAVVVASDRYIARDAADAIVVTYDPLPAVVDPEQAMTGQPTVIHPDFPNNLAVALVPSGTGVSADGKHVDDSAIEKAFAEAEVVHLAAHDEPAAGAQRDGAARRRRALRAGQGHR